MNYLYLIAAIIAVLAGFIGLVILIKGFADKSDKNIKLGTLLVSIGLVIALSGVFCIGSRAAKFARYHLKNRQMMINKCMKDCDIKMMKNCMMIDSTITDSSGMKIITKMVVDKKCCPGKCKGHKF